MLSILVRREQVDQGGQRHAGPTTEGSPYPQQRLNRTLVRDSCSEGLGGGGGGGDSLLLFLYEWFGTSNILILILFLIIFGSFVLVVDIDI